MNPRRMTLQQVRWAWRLANTHEHAWAVLLTEDMAVAANDLGGLELISALVHTVHRVTGSSLSMDPDKCVDCPEWSSTSAGAVHGRSEAGLLEWTADRDVFWLTVYAPDDTEPSALLTVKYLVNGDILSWTRSNGPHRVDQVDMLRGGLAAALRCTQEQAEKSLLWFYETALPAPEEAGTAHE